MRKNWLLSYLWLLVVMAGYPTGYWLVSSPTVSIYSVPLAKLFAFVVNIYHVFGMISIQTGGSMAYAAIFLALLIWSCVCWIKAPSLKTLLWTLFTGWGLFGVPGMFFFWWIGSMG